MAETARGEVKALARSKHGDLHVNQKPAKAELSRVNREIKRLRAELAPLVSSKRSQPGGSGKCSLGGSGKRSLGIRVNASWGFG